MVGTTELITFDDPVKGRPGLVYSTEPRRAEGADKLSYFIKGPDLDVVFPEIAGCCLAREMGLTVPNVSACYLGNQTYAGSQQVRDAIREIDPWLPRQNKVGNFQELYEMIVVDVWLANKDRNIGNVLAESQGGSRVRFVMIDFEKSRALRPTPTVSSNMLSNRELWPSGDLGRWISQNKPLHAPESVFQRISNLKEERCRQILDEVVAAIKTNPGWVDDSAHALMTRARQIRELVGRVWAAN